MAPGLFGDDSEDATPVRNPPPGQYEIRGKIKSLKGGELVVVAGGKNVSGKLAADAEVYVETDDISLAEKNDSVELKADYLEQQKATDKSPGEAVATEVSITLSKPLTAKKKSTGKSPRFEPRQATGGRRRDGRSTRGPRSVQLDRWPGCGQAGSQAEKARQGTDGRPVSLLEGQ